MPRHVVGPLAVACLAALACAAPREDDALDDEQPIIVEGGDELSSSHGLRSAEMTRVATPAGLPKVWSQPDSDGWFDERGKCGPTAVANTLRLYGKEVSPDAAYEAGVRWVVGSRPVDLASYLRRTQPQLQCRVTFPPDGPAFVRAAIRSGRPVMAWFRTEGLTSHWVTVAGLRGSGATEEVVVMSWGRYYRVPMARFAEAWQSVYGFHNPSVTCAARSTIALPASP